MARSVFYSFHYQKDINRVMIVRNRWMTCGGQIASGVIDHAKFEEIRRQGDDAVKRWIKSQMFGTSATIVLIGEETLKRRFVQYEIQKSLEKGNAIIGVYVHRLSDLLGHTSYACPSHTFIGYSKSGRALYFDMIADGIYDYILDDGYNNLNLWVEKAVKKHC